jgi:endonuclease/exonuclease/phosphatase family metal-dependent hydrolase
MFRVATFNIRHGAPARGRVNHGALVRTCAGFDADVIGLQEVDSRRLRSAFRNQATLVAHRLGFTVIYGAVLQTGLFGRYGNALLARGAIRDVNLVQLPRPSRRQARGAILARVELHGVDVSVAVTHLQHHPARFRHQPPEAPLQLRALLDILKQRPAPRMLLGDLNLGLSRAKTILDAAGFESVPESPTVPAEQPRVTLDYIAVDGLQIVDSAVIPIDTSDHRPVVASLEISPLARVATRTSS